MQCSKSSDPAVAPVAVNGTCISGQTPQADGTCKSPNGTITCKVVETKNASGQCVPKTCPSGQSVDASGQCVASLTWTNLPATSDMKTLRYKFGTAFIGTKIYAFAGQDRTGDINTTEYFDTTTNVWTSLPATSNLIIARNNFGTATIGTKIYAFGGYNSYIPDLFINTTEVFDTATNVWTKLPTNLNLGKEGLGSVVIGTKIYAFGGLNYTSLQNTTEVFDTATNAWSVLSATLNTARFSMGSAVVGTKIYVFGGRTLSGALNTTEVFDTTTNSWTQIPATLKSARYNMGTATIGTKIYVFVGYNGFNSLDTTEVFDTATNDWSMLPSASNLTTAINGMGVSVIGNRILAIGGSTGSGNREALKSIIQFYIAQ